MTRTRFKIVPMSETLVLALLLGFVATTFPVVAAPPDLTNGGKSDGFHDWTLGPTGARGWIYGEKGTTESARQILVTAVAERSPADGKLERGDVILGIDGKPFDGDARKQFARAITTAETADNRGMLNLVRWREGKTENVKLNLMILGSYSETAPYDCLKSKRILDLGCKAIAERGLRNVSIPNSLNALALLAADKKEYQPLLEDYAKKVANYRAEAFASWYYGYAVLYLAEYVAATGDKSVMPGLERLCHEIAEGASNVGTWGHRFSGPDGRCLGYGCMNSPGLVLTTALIAGREAGVRDPEVDRVIERSSIFLRWYANKGAVPYGDHTPWPGHEDNGKNSTAAVMFDLLGDAEAATYFAKAAAAAYDERERGHTGNFFNVLWAMPGVSRCGPVGTGAYWDEASWYYDLARDWRGNFRYQGSPQGEEEHNKYTRWDCTGAYMLAFALPERALLITGEKPSVVKPLDASETARVIAAGGEYFPSRGREGYQDRTVEELLAGLSSWSPMERKRSAMSLSKMQGDFVPTLTRMLGSSDRNTQYGACEALALLGGRADPAAAQLRALLSDSDPWTQSLACVAISRLGPEAYEACVPAILRMTLESNPNDPRRIAHRAAASALFGRYRGPKPRIAQANILQSTDRDLLYAAVRAILQNEDGRTRSELARLYGELTEDDLRVLMPDILAATKELAPSGIMFASEIRMAGLEVLARNKVSEGIEMIVDYSRNQKGHGSENRLKKVMRLLETYGAHAQRAIPLMEETAVYFDGGEPNYPRRLSQDKARVVRETIEKIKTLTDKPELTYLNP